MEIEKILLLGVGSFSLLAAALDWNWFFNHPKAAFFIRIFGNSRRNARIFYAAIGILLISISFI